jgi:hypothetical protein
VTGPEETWTERIPGATGLGVAVSVNGPGATGPIVGLFGRGLGRPGRIRGATERGAPRPGRAAPLDMPRDGVARTRAHVCKVAPPRLGGAPWPGPGAPGSAEVVG